MLPKWAMVSGLTLLGTPGRAHHAFTAEFDSQKPIVLNGKIAKVEWLNPHARVYLDVKEKTGTVTTWELQLASPNVLIRQGWSRDSLKPGALLTVSGYLARDASHLISARTLKFEDGHVSAFGTNGDGGPAK
jgi:hypothetical protein